jgi:hypothetical protein
MTGPILLVFALQVVPPAIPDAELADTYSIYSTLIREFLGDRPNQNAIIIRRLTGTGIGSDAQQSPTSVGAPFRHRGPVRPLGSNSRESMGFALRTLRCRVLNLARNRSVVYLEFHRGRFGTGGIRFLVKRNGKWARDPAYGPAVCGWIT